MIPSTLPETGAPAGKVVPLQDKTGDEADSPLFGDLVAVSDETPDVVVGRLVGRNPEGEPKLDGADAFLEENALAASEQAGDSDTAEELVVRMNVGDTSEAFVPAKTKADHANLIDPPKPKIPTELVDAGKNATRQGGKLAGEDGPKPAIPVDRPSVAQTVVEGRLPQQKSSENTNNLSRVEAVKSEENTPKSPSSMTSALQAAPDKNQLPKELSADAKQMQSPPVEARERRKDLHRETTNVADQKATIPKLTQGPSPAVALAQAVMQIPSEKTEKTNILTISDVAIGAAQADRSSSTPTVQAPATSSTAPEMARQVASQIGMAVTNATGKTTEISLNPEELGRVRLSLSATDGVITLNVLAERAETQDLLRRHIDQLAQEFRALGYSSITFSFGDQNQKPHAETSQLEDGAEAEPQDIAPAIDGVSERVTVGLDLRV